MRSYMYGDVQSCLIYLSVDMICIDNCLQPNPVLFVCMITCGKAYSQFSRGSEGGGMGRGGGDASGTYQPPESATVSTE